MCGDIWNRETKENLDEKRHLSRFEEGKGGSCVCAKAPGQGLKEIKESSIACAKALGQEFTRSSRR